MVTLCMLGNFSCFSLSSAEFYSKLTFFKNLFRIIIKVGNGSDPDRERHSVQVVCKDFQQIAKIASSNVS